MAELIVRASKITEQDELSFSINGKAVRSGDIKTIFLGKGRPAKFGRPLGPHRTFMIALDSEMIRFGDNHLEVTVSTPDGNGADEIVIDELEVTVVPPPQNPQ